MFIKKKLKYFTRPKQISPDLSGVSGDFRIFSALLPFCVLVTEAWNVGQGHKPPHGISRSCQDEQVNVALLDTVI